MQNYFAALFIIFLIGLIASVFSYSIYRQLYPAKAKSSKDKISAYKPVFIVIFLALMAVAALGWQESRYDSASPHASLAGVVTPNDGDYVKNVYPVYDDRYKLASVGTSNTVTINMRGRAVKVKLLGVQDIQGSTAAQTQCIARTSSLKLNDYLKDQQIRLEGDDSLSDKDKNGSLLRYLTVGADNINRKLIATGYATVSPETGNYKYLSEFKAEQKRAKDKKLGFYSGRICKPQIVAKATDGTTPAKPKASPGSSSKPAKGNQPSAKPGGGNSGGGGDSCNNGLLGIGRIVNGILGRC